MSSIKVVNKQTGEYQEYEYQNSFELKQLYDNLQEQKKSIERALEKVKAELGKEIPEDEPVTFPDGSTAKWMSTPRYDYPKEVVAKYLDPDQLDVVTKVDGTKLKTLVKEMVDKQELPAGAWEDIMNHADTQYTKPFVRIEK